jgi:hypothetical protein
MPHDLAEHTLLQDPEVIGFAEELGLVGGDGVDQMDRLMLQPIFIEQIVAILREGRVTGRLQSTP